MCHTLRCARSVQTQALLVDLIQSINQLQRDAPLDTRLPGLIDDERLLRAAVTAHGPEFAAALSWYVPIVRAADGYISKGFQECLIRLFGGEQVVQELVECSGRFRRELDRPQRPEPVPQDTTLPARLQAFWRAR